MRCNQTFSEPHLHTAGMSDHYEILGVKRTATAKEIKSAYRRAAKRHHPDYNPGDPTAEARFKACSEAYAVLSDPARRARYDATEPMPRPTTPPPRPAPHPPPRCVNQPYGKACPNLATTERGGHRVCGHCAALWDRREERQRQEGSRLKMQPRRPMGAATKRLLWTVLCGVVTAAIALPLLADAFPSAPWDSIVPLAVLVGFLVVPIHRVLAAKAVSWAIS